MSTPLWTIVYKACRCSKPLDGWASQHFTTSYEPQGLKCLDEHVSVDDRVQRFVRVRNLARLGKPTLFMTRSESEALKCLDEHVSLDDRVQRTDGV